MEGEEIAEVFFLIKGFACYVLPRFSNKPYKVIEVGQHFGHIDFSKVEDMVSMELGSKRLKRQNISRRFTIQAIEACQMYTLSIDELEKMRLEFPDHYLDFFKGAHYRLQNDLVNKLEMIKKCEAEAESKSNIK